MAYKIQKMGVSGILDQAITLIKNHFGLLFGIVAMAWLPCQIVVGLLGGYMQSMAAAPPEQAAAMMQSGQFQIVMIAIGVLSLIAGLVILPISNAAVIYAVSEQYLGRSTTPGEAMRFGFSRLGALIWTSILMGLAIMGGLILLVVPGILCMLWFGLAQHVVVLEGLSGGKALGRSRQLTRSSMGTFVGLGIVAFAINFALGLAIGLIPEPYTQNVLAAVVNSLMTAFSTALFVVYYFSCRCGLENFDLELLAKAVGESAPGTTSADDELSV